MNPDRYSPSMSIPSLWERLLAATFPDWTTARSGLVSRGQRMKTPAFLFISTAQEKFDLIWIIENIVSCADKGYRAGMHFGVIISG